MPATTSPARSRRLGNPRPAWPHAPNCACECWQVFTCDRCGRVVGWCLGCDDDMPGACDDCWCQASKEQP